LNHVVGFTRMANFKAVIRLFRRFTQRTNESVMDALYHWMFGHLAVTGLTLNLDSTVMAHKTGRRAAITRPNAGAPAIIR
jgi:hypothetical protein